MREYSFFIDSENNSIGVEIDDGDTLSIDEYNALQDKEKPTLMELMQLLLSSYPETIDDFRERLVLIDDPEWEVREQLIFLRGDGGEDILNRSFKADRAGVEMSKELLPGISYKQLFANTVNYQPNNSNTIQEEAEVTIAVATPRKFSLQTLWGMMKLYPWVTVMLFVAFITLSVGLYQFQATPNTIILAPDKLQQAAQIDQKLNELKVKVDDLWDDLKSHMLLPNKDKKNYWQRLKPLNLQYRDLRRSGFGHGNKFKVINDKLKKIKDRLRPKRKTKVKSESKKLKQTVKAQGESKKLKQTVKAQGESKKLK
jgi:hypothetical protein